MSHSKIIFLPNKIETIHPPFEKHKIQCPESIIRYFLRQHTKRGDVVLDPFAGLGSTLYIAESMGRTAYGIEADRRRYSWIKKNLSNPGRIIFGDSANLANFGLPKFNFAFTSPPYMPNHHQWNTLCPKDPRKRGYSNYLKQIKIIFKQVSLMMKRGSVLVIQADNLTNGQYTPLAWDIASVVSDVMKLQGETVVSFGRIKKKEEFTYCFSFLKT